MPTHHIASWLVKHSDIPLTVLKPVATRIGVSTNHLGAALFAGQIVYENQDTIVKYANTGGVAVGGFLHERAAERYGEDHALTEYLGENVAALNEAFEGTEEEAATFAEFYRQFRQVDRDTPSVSPGEELLNAAREGVSNTREAMSDAKESVRGATGAMSDASGTVRDAKGAVSEATGAMRDATGSIPDVRTDSETEAVEIPVSNSDSD